MAIFFLILVILSALLLVLIVMLQDEQGEGLGGIFGGGSGTPFGSRAGNVLTRITTVLAVIFISCTLVLALLNKSSLSDSTIDTARQEQYEGEEAGWYIRTGEVTETPEDNDSLLLDIGSDSDMENLQDTDSEDIPEASSPEETESDAG